MASEAQRKAIAKYKEKMGNIRLYPPKELQEEFKAHAAARGESLQAFMIRAAKEQMARDNTES